MTKLRRLVAISILSLSLFGIALAEGGDTHGPPTAPPAPTPTECSADCSSIEAPPQIQPTQDSTVDIITTAEMFAAWLAMSIL